MQRENCQELGSGREFSDALSGLRFGEGEDELAGVGGR